MGIYEDGKIEKLDFTSQLVSTGSANDWYPELVEGYICDEYGDRQKYNPYLLFIRQGTMHFYAEHNFMRRFGSDINTGCNDVI